MPALRSIGSLNPHQSDCVELHGPPSVFVAVLIRSKFTPWLVYVHNSSLLLTW